MVQDIDRMVWEMIKGIHNTPGQDHIMVEPAQDIHSTFQEWSGALFTGSYMVQNKIVSYEKQSRTLTGWSGK